MKSLCVLSALPSLFPRALFFSVCLFLWQLCSLVQLTCAPRRLSLASVFSFRFASELKGSKAHSYCLGEDSRRNYRQICIYIYIPKDRWLLENFMDAMLHAGWFLFLFSSVVSLLVCLRKQAREGVTLQQSCVVNCREHALDERQTWPVCRNKALSSLFPFCFFAQTPYALR
jgi:hypothetical protein